MNHPVSQNGCTEYMNVSVCDPIGTTTTRHFYIHVCMYVGRHSSGITHTHSQNRPHVGLTPPGGGYFPRPLILKSERIRSRSRQVPELWTSKVPIWTVWTTFWNGAKWYRNELETSFLRHPFTNMVSSGHVSQFCQKASGWRENPKVPKSGENVESILLHINTPTTKGSFVNQAPHPVETNLWYI